MTTTIEITANGNYVAEGTLTRTPAMGQAVTEPVKVGPGNMVKQSFSVWHENAIELRLTERPATPEEIEAAKPKPAEAEPMTRRDAGDTDAERAVNTEHE